MGSRIFYWARSCQSHLMSSVMRKTVDGGKQSFFSRSLLHTLSCHNFVCTKIPQSSNTTKMSRKRGFHGTGICEFISRDYYEILGIPENASHDVIKKAFHELAKKYHPDANRNNPAGKRKFQDIRDAYETLRDPQKRATYNMERKRSSENVEYSSQDSYRFQHGFKSQFSGSFQQIFSEIFDGEDRFADDIHVGLSLTFSEAAKGCTKHLSFGAFVPCDLCYGRGYPSYAKAKLCPTCRGSGRVTIPPFTSVCSSCKGLGSIIKERCKGCNGLGNVEGVKDVEVTLPPGLEDGSTISVSKAGNAGGGGAHPGNLYIKVKVAEDPVFSREGTDVYVNAKITFTQAILGDKLEVPTLSGKTVVRIPKGVQHGQLLVLRGKGLPQHGLFVDHGDQYVRFNIYLPTSINERQRAILEEFAREEVLQDSTGLVDESWWQKIISRATTHESMLKFSIFIIILLLFNKIGEC